MHWSSICHKAKIGLNFSSLLQRGLCTILTALPCPDRSLLSPLTPPPCSSSPVPLPRSQQTDPPTPSPQGNKQGIIYSSPFPLVPSVFISLSLCSLSLSPYSLFLSLPLSPRLQVQSQSGESWVTIKGSRLLHWLRQCEYRRPCIWLWWKCWMLHGHH